MNYEKLLEKINKNKALREEYTKEKNKFLAKVDVLKDETKKIKKEIKDKKLSLVDSLSNNGYDIKIEDLNNDKIKEILGELESKITDQNIEYNKLIGELRNIESNEG